MLRKLKFAGEVLLLLALALIFWAPLVLGALLVRWFPLVSPGLIYAVVSIPLAAVVCYVGYTVVRFLFCWLFGTTESMRRYH